jgi:hypothetical protein
MNQYSFKRGFSPDGERIKSLIKNIFQVEIKEDDGKYIVSYGAFQSLMVWIDNKKLCVDSVSNKSVTDEIVLDTNKRYRTFLDEATGYSSKERLKMAKKEVQGS